MDFHKLRVLLSSPESKHNLKALIDIRTRIIKTKSGVDGLLTENFVEYLVSLLSKSNPKIIDITLSILANLMQEEVARQQIRSSGGLAKLMNIVQNIEDVNILCRAWRAVANAAQDGRNISLLHQLGLASHLSQAMASMQDTATQVVLVRCARIAGDTDKHRGYLMGEGALEGVVTILLSLEDMTKPDLCKAVAKCLAKLSHGARLDEAEKLLPGVAMLVKLASEAKRDISENSLGALVNLSQLDQLRPSLGNAEVIDVLVKKFHNCEKNSKLSSSVMTALCLYCRESVNRVKLREVGGCKLFVEVLSSKEEEMLNLQDIVLNSMLQFIFDNHSLNVLMDEGLIPSLVGMLEEHSDTFRVNHRCDLLEHTDNDNVADCEEVIEPKYTDDEMGDLETESNNVLATNEEIKELPTTDKEDVMEDVEESGPKSDEPGPKSDNPGPVFRITSPSYQAVQYELEQFMQLRTNIELNTSGSGSPRWPLSVCSGGPSSPQSPPSSPPDWIPLSPSSSICFSPDRSPPPLSCGFSPSSSETGQSPTYSSCPSPDSSRSLYSPLLYSPSASPPYSPPEPSYSPIENFSDEECETIDNVVEEDKDVRDKINESVQSLDKVNLDSASEPVLPNEILQHVEPLPSTSREPEPSFEPWTKRTLKIQRTRTYLGQTFTLPSRTRSPSPPMDSPAKRPKLSPCPAYKYSASPLPRSKSNSIQPVKHLRAPVGPPQKVKKPFYRISSIMQILAHLSQAERPHADLTCHRTITSIFSYMSLFPTGLEKSSKIFNRLSTNLYCLFPFFISRHFSYLTLALEDLDMSTTKLGCSKCMDSFQEVKKVIQVVGHNLTLLAETGYGEGEICHRLVHPMASKEDKQAISLSAALLVGQRKMLRNILITHDSLDMLLDILEAGSEDAVTDEVGPDQSTSLFSQAVLSVSHLAAHLGVVSPSLTLPEEVTGQCCREISAAEDNLTLVLDDGSAVAANKEILCSFCPVFAAMFSGSFSESGQSSIPLPHTSSQALSCLLHYLYSCQLCKQFSDLSVPTLLELVSLSDKYLLPDLNLLVSHCIIRRCVSGPHLVELYRLALQKEYPVQFGDRTPGTLAQATVHTLLVGDMASTDRVKLMMKLISSQLSGDFIDDVSKILRGKLLERT